MKKVLIIAALVSVLGASVAIAGHGGKGGRGDCGGPGVRGPGMEHKGMMMDMLKNKLSLNTAQAAQVETIMQEQLSKAQALQEQTRLEMEKMRTESESRIAALLTPEQAATFQQMQSERKQRMEQRFENMKQRMGTQPL